MFIFKTNFYKRGWLMDGWMPVFCSGKWPVYTRLNEISCNETPNSGLASFTKQAYNELW